MGIPPPWPSWRSQPGLKSLLLPDDEHCVLQLPREMPHSRWRPRHVGDAILPKVAASRTWFEEDEMASRQDLSPFPTCLSLTPSPTTTPHLQHNLVRRFPVWGHDGARAESELGSGSGKDAFLRRRALFPYHRSNGGVAGSDFCQIPSWQ